MVGKADPQIFDRARIWVTDAFAPLLDAASKPVATGAAIVDEARHLMHLREENAALRLENSRLLQWQAAARELAAENARLHSLLNYVPAPEATFISARIIAETGGSFVRTMLVNAGRRDGVRKGLPVVIGEGLIGRIVETGERVSRILLINDLNSRIPVAVGDDRERAVLAGDNTSQPKIAYLVANAYRLAPASLPRDRAAYSRPAFRSALSPALRPMISVSRRLFHPIDWNMCV